MMMKLTPFSCCCFQLFLTLCLVITLIFAKEVPYKRIAPLPSKANGQVEVEPSGPLAVFQGFRNLPSGMPSVLLVTGLTWVCKKKKPPCNK
jgi:solute carrier family 45 protein 1/2/4